MSHSSKTTPSKPTKIRANHVYRGKSGRTRLVLHSDRWGVDYVDQKGVRCYVATKNMLRWAVAEVENTEHRSELGVCPICRSSHVAYYNRSEIDYGVTEISIRCEGCGFCSPFKAPGERRRLSQKGMKEWWLKIAAAIRKGGL